MRRLFARPDSPSRFRASVEELEDRAQPALLTFAVGVPALSFETQVSFFAAHGNAGVTLPPQANQHAQIVVALHTGSNSPPTTPPTNPTTNPPTSPPATDPTPTQTSANATGSSPSPTPTPTSAGGPGGITPTAFAFLASVAGAIPTAATSAASSPAASGPAGAVSSLLLPPDATALAGDATALPVLAREAPTELVDAQAGIPTFPAPAPILYLRGLSAPERPELFGNTNRLAVYDAANPLPNSVSPPVAPAPDRTQEVAEGALTLPQLFPVVAENEPAAPVAAPPVPTEASEEGTSPWVWAATVAGVVAGTSWLLHRHLRKSMPSAQPVRDWRDYPLGLDVDRL